MYDITSIVFNKDERLQPFFVSWDRILLAFWSLCFLLGSTKKPTQKIIVFWCIVPESSDKVHFFDSTGNHRIPWGNSRLAVGCHDKPRKWPCIPWNFSWNTRNPSKVQTPWNFIEISGTPPNMFGTQNSYIGFHGVPWVYLWNRIKPPGGLWASTESSMKLRGIKK